MMEKYKTVDSVGEAEIVEKKSRFIANVSPVESEQEALAFIESIKKKYRDARHNCFAFQIGSLQRLSDDGEPSSTAGRPMLDILIGEELQNIVVVVTRYFGGTLLGTGGLVRAYSKSAKEGINACGIIEKALYAKINFEFEYTELGKILYEANQAGHIVEDIIYTDKVCAVIAARCGVEDKFISKINDITNGKVIGIIIDKVYITLK